MLCEGDDTIVFPLGTLEETIVVSGWWFGGESERVPSHSMSPSTTVNEGTTEILELYL
jgi:hypothetical protein